MNVYIDQIKLDDDLTEYCAKLLQAINSNQAMLNDDSWKELYRNDNYFRMSVRAVVHSVSQIVKDSIKDNQQHTGDL